MQTQFLPTANRNGWRSAWIKLNRSIPASDLSSCFSSTVVSCQLKTQRSLPAAQLNWQR